MTQIDQTSALDALLLEAEISRFFSAEAELLDERRFDEWLDLLHEDLRYWMPIARNVRFDQPKREYTREGSEANWFDEGKETLRKRVLQIQGGDHWAEEPRSRTTHLVANVRIDKTDGADITAKSRFVVCAYRLEHDFDLFIGKRVDVLRREQGALKVLRRTIYLDQSVLLSRNLTTFFEGRISMKRSTKVAAAELVDNLDFLIRDTRLRLYNYIESRIGRHNIPLRIWFPLRALYKNEGITQRELGQMLGFGDAHAGVIVGVMQRRHLLYREPSRTDKRRINLYLTPAGRKMAQTTLREMRAINSRIIAGFSEADARSLQTLLFRAHENLDDK